MAVGRRGRLNPGGHVGRVAVPPGGIRGRPPRVDDDGHTGLPRRHLLDTVELVGAPVGRCRDARHAHADEPDPARGARGSCGDLLRGRVHDRRIPADGPLPGGARTLPRGRRAAFAAAHGREGGNARAHRPRDGRAHGERRARLVPAGRRPLRGAPGREGGDRRHHHRGVLRPGHLPPDRRVRARGRGPRRRGDGRDRQHVGIPAGASHARRLGHDARADRAHGCRGPGRQGTRPAPRGPDFGRVRAHRHPCFPADPRRLAARGRQRAGRVHGGRRRPRRGVPVRARPGHADRDPRRVGTRLAARYPVFLTNNL